MSSAILIVLSARSGCAYVILLLRIASAAWLSLVSSTLLCISSLVFANTSAAALAVGKFFSAAVFLVFWKSINACKWLFRAASVLIPYIPSHAPFFWFSFLNAAWSSAGRLSYKNVCSDIMFSFVGFCSAFKISGLPGNSLYSGVLSLVADFFKKSPHFFISIL